jgi:DNA-binding response OmpR family regulator
MKTDEPPLILFYSPRERLRDILIAGLLQCNYRMIDTSSPYLAIIKISQFQPDLVIVDLPHNFTKGFVIVSALKKAQHLKNTPVIVAVPPEPTDFINSVKAEYLNSKDEPLPENVHVITYPFNFSELLAKINTLLK